MNAARFIRRRFLQYISPRATAANVMRMALKSSGVMSLSAFLMRTKVDPQTKVTTNQKQMGFEGAGQ